jgi:Raf kinase inhibitor-like YbhB/YbcL family protein
MNNSLTKKIAELIISSPAFEPKGNIPKKYTCDGEKLSPPLHISSIPAGTLSLAIISEDPDAPKGVYDHWIAWNIDPEPEIREGANPGISGVNGAGKTGYHPPCPPQGRHRYFFHIYALDTLIALEAGATKDELKKAMKDHIIAKGSIMGYYSRK